MLEQVGRVFNRIPAAVVCFFAPAATIAWFAGPELPTLGGALIGGLLFIALATWLQANRVDAVAGSSASLALAAMPYLLVLALILLTRLISPLGDALQEVVLNWRIGERYEGSIAPLYHPGTILIVALVVSALVVGRSDRVLSSSLRSAAARLPPVALALVAVLLLARLMVHSGMIDTLAGGASDLLGAKWPIAAPLIAALGSFVTGSATASNIILADFQVAASAAAGVTALIPLAGQGFGSAIGNIIAPHNIVAGAATVGLLGREGEVLKRTLPVCIVYAGLGGTLFFVLAQAF